MSNNFLRALENSLQLSDYADFGLITQILPLCFSLRNRYLICVIKEFRTFSELLLWFEIFFNGGGEGFSDFFLKVVTVEQAFIFPIGDESHFHQDRGDVRGF